MQRNHTYPEVKAMLQAYLEEIKLHALFADRMLNDELSIEETNEYLNDTLGADLRFTEASRKQLKETILPELQKGIQKRIDFLLAYLEKSQNESEAVAIIALNYCLQDLTGALKVGSKKSNNSESMKLLCALSRRPVLDSIHVCLIQLTDNNFKLLSKYVRCVTHTEKRSGNLYTYSTFEFNWNQMMREINARVGQIFSALENDKNLDISVVKLPGWKDMVEERCRIENLDSEDYLQERFGTIFKPLHEKTVKFLAKMEPIYDIVSKQTGYKRELSSVSVMLQNIKFFHSIVDELVEFQFVLSSTLERVNVIKNLIHEVSANRQLWESQNSKLYNRLKRLARSILKLQKKLENEEEKVSDKQALAALTRQLHKLMFVASEIQNDISQQTNEYKLEYSKAMLEAFNRTNTARITECLKQVNTIDKQLKNLMQTADMELVCEDEEIEASKPLVSVLRAAAPRVVLVENEQELDRGQFTLMKKNERDAYRRNVEENRRLRSQLKKEDTVITKKSPAVVVLEPANAVMTKVFRNKLCSLPESYFAVLLDLFDPKAKVKYRDVCHLIENHLNGRIEEIGNGSSHKRIRIENCVTFMELDAQQSASESVAETDVKPGNVVTGGMFKQHSKSRDKSVMARFNKELVKNTLERAGITLQLLEEIQRERQRLRME